MNERAVGMVPRAMRSGWVPVTTAIPLLYSPIDISNAGVVLSARHRGTELLLMFGVFKISWVVPMGDTVFYMRSSSPQVGISSGALPDSVIDDFRSFLNLNDGDFESALKLLANATGFLRRPDIRKLLASQIDREQAKILSRLVYWQHGNISTDVSLDAVMRLLGAVESAHDSGGAAFTEVDLKLIRDRLEKISKVCGALDRQKKAENLGKATGQRLEKLQLICDFRPIFDSNRNSIDGFIPLTTLHLVFEGADGLPNAIDVILSESDVSRLAEQAEFAKSKLIALKLTADRLNIPVPNTELTVSPDQKSK